MLAKPKYFPDKRSGWKIPPDTDPSRKASELGMKLTCGFEMLASQAEKRNSSYSDLPNSSQKFERFIKKLEQSGYFQGEMEGSRKHSTLLEQARTFYSTSTGDENDPNSDLRFSSEILRMSKDYRPDATEGSREEDSVSSDDESWLDVEPESFDNLLRQHFKVETEKMEFAGAAPDEKSESELPNEIKRFLQSLSEFDGIQVFNFKF